MAATLISCGAFVPLAVKWPLHTLHSENCRGQRISVHKMRSSF